MKALSHLLKSSSKSLIKGFTLVELLAAASLTSVVVGVSGYALLTMLNLNMKARADSTLAYEVNRSIEFISDEIKTAANVKPDAATAVREIPDFTLPSGATPILVLTLTNEKNVVYYSQPASQPWGGKQVVVRWGPRLNEEGKYDDSTVNTPSSWSHSVLMDYVSNDVIDDNQCPENWRLTNNEAKEGFYACVPKTDTNGSLVQFGMLTEASHVVGKNSQYAAQTNAYARSKSTGSNGFQLNCTGENCVAQKVEETQPVTTEPVVAAAPSPTFGVDANVENGKIVVNGDANVTFSILGTQLTCGANGDKIPVTATIQITDIAGTKTQLTLEASNPTQTLAVKAGSVVDMVARAKGGSCNYSSAVTTRAVNPKVVALINGDNVPNITPFANQTSISSLVQPYVMNGKMNLKSNEAIHLFELGSNNISSEAFDLQDLVLLTSVSAIR